FRRVYQHRGVLGRLPEGDPARRHQHAERGPAQGRPRRLSARPGIGGTVMHLTSVRRGRRRATALAAGAVAVSLSACGTFGGEESESSTSTYEPVETTSTSEPSTSSSSTTEGDPQPDPPDGTALLNQSKQHMSVMSTVTIDGTLSIAKGNDRVP